ncbi:hypothetical protein D3C85_1515130 [compost metagenome]
MVEPASDIAGGEVTESDAWAEGDTGAGVSTVHDRIHFVASSVEAGDRRAAAIQHVGLAIGDQATG